MKNPPVQRNSGNRLTLFAEGRRSFVGGLATLGAGIAGSVILPKSAMAQPAAGASPNTELVTGACGPTVVIASDAATVGRTTAGRSLGFKRNGNYVVQGVPN